MLLDNYLYSVIKLSLLRLLMFLNVVVDGFTHGADRLLCTFIQIEL